MRKGYRFCTLLLSVALIMLILGGLNFVSATIYDIDDDEFDIYEKESDNYISWMIPENIPRCDLYEYRHINPIYGKIIEEKEGKLYFSFKMAYASCKPSDNEEGYVLSIYKHDYLPKISLWPKALSKLDTKANWLEKLLDIQTNPLLEKRITRSRFKGYFDVELVFDLNTLFILSKNTQEVAKRRYFDYYYMVEQNIEFKWFLAFKENRLGGIEGVFISEM